MLPSICFQDPFLPKLHQSFKQYNLKSMRQNNFQQPTVQSLSYKIESVVVFIYPQQLIFQILTPLSRPIYIQVQGGRPSPYLKQLLSKVGTSQIQFWDFTLDGADKYEQQDFQQYQQLEKKQKQMSIIEEEQDSSIVDNSDHNQRKGNPTFQYNPEQYIPNMHLLDIDPLALRLTHFQQTLKTFSSSEEEKREFISLYLTDEDLQNYKDAEIEALIQIVHFNLSLLGIISRLERKAKVSRYIQKKKKRIWRKKINYDCRKRVADNRLRVKGKFVTREQACTMLGIEDCSQQELKQLLKTNYRKMMF